MGLLDDAIREHLELKRRRGADPGEVAREQREALEPVPRTEHGARDSTAAGNISAEATGRATPVDVPPAGDDAATTPRSGPGTGGGDQETAELDMRGVLEQDAALATGSASPATPVAAGLVQDTSRGEHPDEDSLEWEVPGKPTRDRIVGVRHDRHAVGEGSSGTEEGPDRADPAADVQEPAPDLLHIAGEQEHLWPDRGSPGELEADN